LKGDFLYNFLFPTRIAGGFLFRFAQLPKGINDPGGAAMTLLRRRTEGQAYD